jgi:hypothetical protein
MSQVSILGIDLAKQIFHVVGLDDMGNVVLRRRIPRSALMAFIAQLPPVVIGMEACGGAHYWARRFREHGHVVKLMAPQFVKPYVKSNKHGRCSRAVDFISDGSPKLVAIDEEAHDQIVHRRRFRKANCATHKTLDPCPQIDMFALDFLGVLLADHVLLRSDMPLVGALSIRVKPCDPKRLQQALEFEKDGVLPSSKDIG